MKKIALLLLLPLIFTFIVENKKSPSLNGHWTLICYSNLFKGTSDCKTVEEQDFPLVFDFKDDGEKGTFVGHTSSNDVSGDYVISDTNKINVTRFGGTKAGECNAFGRQFWKAINSSSSFKIIPDTLTIFYDKDTQSMTFLKTDKK